MLDFSGRVVLVTGAAGNLGRAVANGFMEAGAQTAVVDRSLGRLETLYAGAGVAHEPLRLSGIDVTQPDSVSATVSRTLERFGRLDVLVNTVGGFRAGKPVAETPLEDWDLMFDLNVRTAFMTARVVVPHFLERRYGRIINVGARPGYAGRAGMAAYSASKAALLRLTESLSEEVKGQGITVNAVIPGTLDTPQNRAAMPDADPSTWVRPEAVAFAIQFLASAQAEAITGAALPVYGRS